MEIDDSSDDGMVEIVTIEFVPKGDNAEFYDVCMKQIGKEVSVEKVSINNLPELEAPDNVKKQYYDGLKKMTLSIIENGLVEMDSEVYNSFTKCALTQGYTLEQILAMYVLQGDNFSELEMVKIA